MIGVVMWMGCGANMVHVAPADIQEEQRVVLKLNDGSIISGLALQVNSKSILLQDDVGEEHIVFVKNIAAAKGPQPIFDDNNQLISQLEIDSTKTRANKTAYAVVGGLMSLGVSYLAGTLVERDVLQENNNAVIYSSMAAGALSGAALFAAEGARKDREMAVQTILDSRQQMNEILSLPDDETDKLIKKKIADIIAQRQEVEKKIDQVLQEIDDLDRQLLQHNKEN